jgi:uncharacterized protein (TIGR02145 family)
MMKRGLLLLAIFCGLQANAQNYLITFAGTGASNTVNSVKVENLSNGISLILNGSDILRLTLSTGIFSAENKQLPELKIYPNPMNGSSIMQVYPPEAGNATISVFELTGKQLSQIQSYLDKGLQEFQISGIGSGYYLVSVTGSTYQSSVKLLSTGIGAGTISIEKIGNHPVRDEKTTKSDKKGDLATIDMDYAVGQRLKFTGVSGNYSTFVTYIPTEDKTITFNFIACADGDGNNYPVVEIGTQIWMAENLKTTSYNDETDLANVTADSEWRTLLTTAAYCDYENTPSNSETYGRLYNWHVVDPTNPKNVCPTGWHVSTTTDWVTLATYIGGEFPGNGLKETGNLHWALPNDGATNETGFTALPGGMRSYDGPFTDIGSTGTWWISDGASGPHALLRRLYYDNGYIGTGFSNKEFGYSVRCVKD